MPASTSPSFVRVFFARGVGDQQAGGLDACGHVGEEQLDCLMLADWFAECGALLRVADCGLERCLPYSDGARGLR